MERVEHVSRRNLDVPAETGVGRAAAAGLITIALTAVLTLLGAGTLKLFDGADEGVAHAFLDGGPRLLWSTLWVTAPVWAVMVVAVEVAWRRAPRIRVFTAVVIVTVACAGLTTLGWFVVALIEGGWALLLVAISLITASLFAIAATIAAAITHLWRFRAPRAPVADVAAAIDAAVPVETVR